MKANDKYWMSKANPTYDQYGRFAVKGDAGFVLFWLLEKLAALGKWV